MRETSILSDENIKYYKVFVILFPILFYIPKFFEVQSHYETKEEKTEIDCGKFLNIGKILNDPNLRDIITKSMNMSDDELAKVERLAGACKIIIDEEQIESLTKQYSSSQSVTQFHELTEPPISSKSFATSASTIFTSRDSTSTLNATKTRTKRNRWGERDKRKSRTAAKKRIPLIR